MRKGGDSQLPSHLQGGPTIEEADFLFESFTPAEVTDVHDAVANLGDEIRSDADPEGRRYLLLGNYDAPQKSRLTQARSLLEHFDPAANAFLLSELDAGNDDWSNFYLKFRYTLTFVDHPVLVAEDNDGGHELELGEVPLDPTYVSKRDYEPISIDRDLEYEKYDAMIAKLFSLFERQEQLFAWTDRHGFARSIEAIAADARAPTQTNESPPPGDQPSTESGGTLADAGGSLPEDVSEVKLTPYLETGLPTAWTVNADVETPGPDVDTGDQLLHYVRSDPNIQIKVKVQTNADVATEYQLAMVVHHDGRVTNKPLTRESSYEVVRAEARFLPHLFETISEKMDDPFAIAERCEETLS